MPRKINSLYFSNDQKATLRNFISAQTGRTFRSITDITRYLQTTTSDHTYEVIRNLYNDSIDVERRRIRAESARKARQEKKETKQIKVIFDKKYSNGINSLNTDLKQVAQKLIGKSSIYIQHDGKNAIIKVNGSDSDAIYWNTLYPYFFQYIDGQIVSILKDNSRLVILLSDEIIPLKLQQKYRDGGEKHCVIEPIYNLFMSYANNSVSKESKKKLERTATQIKKYEEVYPDGVPEEDMHIIGKVARLCIIIHDILGNEITRYNSSSSKFIRFTNTRINHLEYGNLCLDEKPEKVTQERLDELIYEHDKEGVFYLLRSNTESVNMVKSIRGCWAVANPENDIMQEFSKSIGIKKCAYDALKYPKMNELILESRIINAAPTPLCDDPNEIENANHIDLSKAYTLHKECEYYKGFCGVLHQWRKLNVTFHVADFLEEHLGIFQFRVTNENAFLKRLGIFKGQLFSLPSVEILYFIKAFKMTCVLTAGAWGSRFDFDYTDEILENRRYCIWAGKNGMQYDSSTYSFKGDSKWASHLASVIGTENVSYYSSAKTISCKIANKVSYTKHHILAFITSYTRINMMEIMRKIPSESLIKVVLDGIYFRGDIPDVKLPHKHNELKKHIGFRDFWYYPSKVDVSSWPEYKKEFDGRCILAGAGGTGKTHTILTDKGFINPRYVVPMHSLGQDIRNKYGVQYDTMHKFIGNGCLSRRSETENIPSVILIDELTMHDGNDIQKAIEMYPECLIFVAGDIDSKQWFQCRNGDNGEFKELWQPMDWRYVFFEKDYRSLDNELKKFKLDIRQKMREVFTNGKTGDAMKIKNWVLENYKTISMEDAITKFTTGDIWISGTHKTNAELLSKGIISGYIKNKQIVYEPEGAEKRGSFTTHSFQGLTISDKRVFITMDNFEYAMFYTAVSRVRKFEQIILVV